MGVNTLSLLQERWYVGWEEILGVIVNRSIGLAGKRETICWLVGARLFRLFKPYNDEDLKKSLQIFAICPN